MAVAGTLTHRKTRKLARLMGCSMLAALGAVEGLIHVTAARALDGAIGRLSNEDIAEELFWDEDADTLIENYIKAGFIDRDPTHRLIVHDWAEHATDAVHAQLARKRLWFADGSAPRLTRLNSTERPAAVAFYSTTTQAPTTRLLPEPSENGSGNATEVASDCPETQEVPYLTIPCLTPPLPALPNGSSSGNGSRPDPESPWKPYHDALFKYFGRDPWPEEWEQIHDWLLEWEKRGDLPPLTAWDAYCRKCNAACRKATKFNPKTTKPLANFMADIFAERGES